MTEFPSENIHSLNKQKRIKLIENYHASRSHEKIEQDQSEQIFEQYLLEKKYPYYDDDETLTETCIRYLIFYLEEYVYELKLKGLLILDHLILNITPSKLNLNMRSALIFDILQRYLNDKESIEFLDKAICTMRSLLNTIETKYSNAEHQYKKHSVIVESLLGNCYMTSKIAIKCIYLTNLKLYLNQMNVFSVRHLEKYLTISLECVESNTEKISFDFKKQETLLIKSLELLECIMVVCQLRLHAHARRIINFLIKLLYFFSLTDEDKDLMLNLESFKLTSKLIQSLFKNEKVKEQFYNEFSLLKSNSKLNKTFLKLIESV